MQKTHLTLHPGEEIRTPSIALLFWEGDRTRAHNMWRRFILAHHTPRPNGKLLQAPIATAAWGEMRASDQIARAKWWRENDIPITTYWIDAGWHGDGEFLEDSNVFNSQWGAHVGNWWPNKTTYPTASDPWAMRCASWASGSCCGSSRSACSRTRTSPTRTPNGCSRRSATTGCSNLGNPEAREALTNLVSDLIAESGVTIYRQDFNTDAAPYWAAADAPDRIGMSEIRHIEGLYRFWDDLLERKPGPLD